ncbi:hypothetical protein ACOSP7_007193 [Xanthoceras sorbifolium]
MCVDFTDLNRECPKDCFHLPRIDQLVDSTAGHQLLSFMDAYSGYNQTFTTLRRYNMRLNPEKCIFGVTSGKFLGFMVHQRGIEANPDKIKAIQELRSPCTIKEIQGLTGRVIALSRFVS